MGCLKNMEIIENKKIAVIGLGYVGLPLAVEFGKFFHTIGFDINQHRVEELLDGTDSTLEVNSNEFKDSKNLSFTNDANAIRGCNIFIITVPTPIDEYKKPDLRPLISASRIAGGFIKKDDIVIYESTVYPGATEEVCVPILEKSSKLKFNVDFYCGYSPERINPGDKEHRLTSIKKVTSGSLPRIADIVDSIYQKIIKAGTHKAPSIKVAEASKVIENTQRDINIALINELALIFNKLDIDTESVLEAAGTKWNFLPFKPGLVGGHCIGVDPYYLAQKAQEHGYHPEIILAGRRLNDGMGDYVASQIVKCMIKKDIPVNGANILVLGITFKENCPDVRNTKAVDLISSLKDYGANITIHDPWANPQEVLHEYALESLKMIPNKKFDAVVLAVSHTKFKDLNFKTLKKDNAIVYDVKNFIDNSDVDARL